MRLRRDGALREFLQQLPKRVGHSFVIFLLPENKRLLLQSRFALARLGIIGQQRVQICQGRAVVFAVLIRKRALRQSGRRLRIIGEGLQEITESFEQSGADLSFAHNTSRVCKRIPRAVWARV